MSKAEGPRAPFAIRVVDDRFTVVRHVVEAVAIVAAGIWAFYTFVYTERIKPANEPAALSSSIEVRRLGRDATREFLVVEADLKNTGKTEIDIAADAYNVWGDAYARRQSSSLRTRSNDRHAFHGLALRSRTLVVSKAELRDAAVGGKRGYHIVIEPGTRESVGEVFVVPRNAYDVIHAQIVVVPVKAGAERVDVTIDRRSDGALLLAVGGKSRAYENEDESDFALSP